MMDHNTKELSKQNARLTVALRNLLEAVEPTHQHCAAVNPIKTCAACQAWKVLEIQGDEPSF